MSVQMARFRTAREQLPKVTTQMTTTLAAAFRQALPDRTGSAPQTVTATGRYNQ